MTASLRTVFYGSPDFAVPILQALIDSPWRPVAVVAQPDRRAGRGRRLHAPPTKTLADQHGIPTVQPERLRDPDAISGIANLKPDLQIVAAYGQLIPTDILELPQHGTLNVHASLLPRWRGAAPIAAAILHGDAQTGITIMLVDATEDTGDILTQSATEIDPDENAGQLGDRLATIGADLLLQTIPRWLAGEVTPQPQDHHLATRARRIRKAQGRIDWSQSAAQIARHVRAYTPWPSAMTTLSGQPIRIAQARPADTDVSNVGHGTVVNVGETIDVSTGDGLLAIQRLQRGGKRELSAAEFARGAQHLATARFGDDHA